VHFEYARFLLGHARSEQANRQLGTALAFVAGAINAGGFLAVGQYTSHVTGMISAVGDNLALAQLGLVVDGLVAVLAFLLGATCCSLMVNYGRRRNWSSAYALPLLLEAALILCFGLLGPQLSGYQGLLLPFTVVLLCFIMGLQNAVVTKLSHGVVRTTHMTGVTTDLGIELGRLLYWNRAQSHAGQAPDTNDGPDTLPPTHPPLLPPVRANRQRMAALAALLGAFVLGGVVGAFGFKFIGYLFTLPLAFSIAALAIVPGLDDLRRARGHAASRPR
jgi:uncharacterized membrane protein YoaK (UPF0700 family)